MATVTAGAHQQRARVLLDSGSGITIITSLLANSLKTKRVRVTHSITGLHGLSSMESKHAVRLTLGSAGAERGETFDITVHVVDQITSDYAPQDLTAIKNQDFVKGKPLTDTEFGKSGRIDIFLSIIDSNRCTHDVSQSSPNRCTRAWDTIFGWVIGGQTDGIASNSVCMKVTTSNTRADEILQRFWLQEEIPGEATGLTPDEQSAVTCFKDTTYRDQDGRYYVELPKRDPQPELR